MAKTKKTKIVKLEELFTDPKTSTSLRIVKPSGTPSEWYNPLPEDTKAEVPYIPAEKLEDKHTEYRQSVFPGQIIPEWYHPLSRHFEKSGEYIPPADLQQPDKIAKYTSLISSTFYSGDANKAETESKILPKFLLDVDTKKLQFSGNKGGNILASEIAAGEDAVRVAKRLIDNPTFATNQTLLEFSSNAKALNQAAEDALNGDFTSAGKSASNILSGVGKKILNTGATLGRTLAEVPLIAEGIHLKWGNVAYSEEGKDPNSRDLKKGTADPILSRYGKGTSLTDIAGTLTKIYSPEAAIDTLKKRNRDTEGYITSGSKDGKDTISHTNFRSGDIKEDNRLPRKNFNPDTRTRNNISSSMGLTDLKQITPETDKGDAVITLPIRNSINTAPESGIRMRRKSPTTGARTIKYKGTAGTDLKTVSREERLTKDFISGSIENYDIYTPDFYEEGFNGADFITTEFRIITPETSPNGTAIRFRSYLSSLSDSFTGDIQGQRYIGRAEEFYTYQGFKRDISFSFHVAALSRRELQPIYDRLNSLMQSTAPSYASNSAGFMRGTITEITLGEYFNSLPGYVTSLKLGWDKETPWEISAFAGEDDVPVRPHVLSVDISFTPIHKTNISTETDFFK